MRADKGWVLGLLVFCLLPSAPAFALSSADHALSRLNVLQATPVVVFGKNSRQSIDDYARARRKDAALVRDQHSASGLIICGDAHGAGQLTLANDVVTTAAHVFYDEAGHLRAPRCFFSLQNGAKRMSIGVDMRSIAAGSTDPYGAPAVHDWAVARLTRPVGGVKPYELGEAVKAEADVEFAARGHNDWGQSVNLSLEACKMRTQLSIGAEGTREFSFDCETGDGASGGAVLADGEGHKLCAVLVGYRSIAPDRALAFSNQHYNFAVTTEGAFRAAIEAAAKPLVVSAGAATLQ